jgi:hypothetical protein
MKCIGVVIVAFALSSCAATPLRQDQARSMAVTQEQQLGVQNRCCTTIDEMNSVQMGGGNSEHSFVPASPIISLDGRPTTASLFKLPTGSSGRALEFISYSDKKRSVFRFDSVLFVAPAFVFLDSSRKPMDTQTQPPLCWGTRSGNGGLWTRVTVPDSAAYVVVAARTDHNLFPIDTRQLGSAAPVIEAIADARRSYVTQVGTGYAGLYSLGLVDRSRPPLGRCAASAP